MVYQVFYVLFMLGLEFILNVVIVIFVVLFIFIYDIVIGVILLCWFLKYFVMKIFQFFIVECMFFQKRVIVIFVLKILILLFEDKSIFLIVLVYFLENKIIVIKGKMIFKLYNVCDDVIILYQFVCFVLLIFCLFIFECCLFFKRIRWCMVLILVNLIGNEIFLLNIFMFDKVIEIKIV